jgi:cobalt-zinc-cadmium resistance protein CzcA
MAIGGKAASQVYEDERKFSLVVRYAEPYRCNAEAIAKIKVPNDDGQMIPIGELASDTRHHRSAHHLPREPRPLLRREVQRA